MAGTFKSFDGWTVTHDEARRQFHFLRPHPTGKPSKRLGGDPALSVTVTYSQATDPMVAYLAGKQDACAEDVRVATDDERADAEARFAAAERDVVVGKVKRSLVVALRGPGAEAETPDVRKGLDDLFAKAIGRLLSVGVSAAEAAAIVEAVQQEV